MSKMIEVHELSKSFNQQKIIHNLNFDLSVGKCVGLIGPNGAGKTTTLRMLAGLLKPTSGDIRIAGISSNQDFRHLLGYLPQHPVFYNWMTGEQFLFYAGKLSGLSKADLADRVDELLLLLNLEENRKKKIGKYSGGMKQRLGIAQSLIHSPKVLILDEPVSALDPVGRREMLELFKKLKHTTMIIFSTHILNDAEEVCDELLFIDRGQLIKVGTIEELRKENQDNQICIEFEKNADQYAEVLQGLGFRVIRVEGRYVFIEVDSIEESRKKLFMLFLVDDWPVRGYFLKELTLEDLFMKVVEHDAVANPL